MAFQMDEKEMKAEAKTNEALAILMCMDNLQNGLSASIVSIAGDCYAQEMIDEDTYDSMFGGKWESENGRAQLLVRYIEKRLKEKDARNVETAIKIFAEVIRKEASFEHLAKLVDNCKTAQDFRKISKKIFTGITASLTTIASGAVAKGLISYSEYVVCTQGDASEEATRTWFVLQQILQGAAKNPDVLYDFMKILEHKGKPISNQCDGIRMALSQLSINTGLEDTNCRDDPEGEDEKMKTSP
ncbi:PREDICTED: uncharacterized protein LOC109592250 [Amphimedon queenslandica]|uniref:Uncharacterized protein n=1 Tax=Amphimedon queenslandica TaxID=400682 RepID=A0A1X7SNA3_AMPQE|nr:PREDICTED: uncharacterized protein LOC109592250 [Amphimedon queenslandica]|eukprot:XP_019863307.1 PREDICTED: uncharacterized protein LOC109592250 [Amphimedon queenslandica]